MVFGNPGGIWYVAGMGMLIILAIGMLFYNRRFRRRFADPVLYDRLIDTVSKPKRTVRAICFWTGMAFLTLAIMGPRFGTKTEIVTQMGIDVAVVVDTSHSMLAEDVRPNRISQARYEIHRLIDSLSGDRVGLIAFAGEAFVQCPLTVDYGAAKTLLDNIDVGIIPQPGTNIGNAIDAAVDLLEEESSGGPRSRTIVLITDGENLEGNIEEAANKAASLGIAIYTAGIGTSAGEIIPIRDDRGDLQDYKKDEQGNIVRTALDETTLRSIARITGGEYLRTVSGETDLDQLIEYLSAMQETGIHERRISRMKEQYQLPLSVSLLFLLTWTVLDERRGGLFSGKRRKS